MSVSWLVTVYKTKTRRTVEKKKKKKKKAFSEVLSSFVLLRANIIWVKDVKYVFLYRTNARVDHDTPAATRMD